MGLLIPKMLVSVNCCEQKGTDLAIISSGSVITAVYFLTTGAVTRRNDRPNDKNSLHTNINNLSKYKPPFSIAISNAAAIEAAV